MSYPTFDAKRALNKCLSGAKFKGTFINHNEAEYNALDWLDLRPKPEWLDVEQAGLTLLRRRIADNLNERTNYAIVNEYEWSKYPGVKVNAYLEWQFNLSELYGSRTLLTYPYRLKVNEDTQATTVYYEVTTVEEWDALYMSLFSFIQGWLQSGRDLKDSLVGMTRTQLEEFRDLR